MITSYNKYQYIGILEKYTNNQLTDKEFIDNFNIEIIYESHNKIITKIINILKWLNNNIKKSINKLNLILKTIYNKLKKVLSSNVLKIVGITILLMITQPVMSNITESINNVNKIEQNSKIDNKEKDDKKTYSYSDNIDVKETKYLLSTAIGYGKNLLKDYDVGSEEYKTLLNALSVMTEIRDSISSTNLNSKEYKYLSGKSKMTIDFLIKSIKNMSNKSKNDSKYIDIIKYCHDLGEKLKGTYYSTYNYEKSILTDTTTGISSSYERSIRF